MFPAVLHTLNAILAAAIGIAAAGLWLYTLTFNLRVRVARAFSLVLLVLVPLYGGEALTNVAETPALKALWLRVLWTGLAFLPATLLHFSDAVLALTGRPSRGRRIWAVRAAYVLGMGFAVAMWWPRPLILGTFRETPAPHFRAGPWAWIFILFYAVVMVFALVNLWRAYRRTVVRVSRRRLAYLLAGALAIAVGSFPYLAFGEALAGRWVGLFWLLGTLNQIVVGTLLFLMAYAAAFFGVALPDRLVQQRLLRWVLRGPVTVSLALAAATLARRWGLFVFGEPYGLWVPLVLVVTLLLTSYLIGLVLPWLERLWPVQDPAADLLAHISERLFTPQDLRQFLEALLGVVCDQLRVDRALLVAFEEEEPHLLVTIGEWRDLPRPALEPPKNGPGYFVWDGYWVRALHDPESDVLLGMLIFPRQKEALTEDDREVLDAVSERAVLALQEWQRSRRVLTSLQTLVQQSTLLPRLRAVARFDRRRALLSEEELPPTGEVFQWVRDALKHYWGGPKLSDNPLLRWKVVQQAAARYDGNVVQGLRAVLREAIEQLRPPGERRFTAEWLLYNILEMKFFQGRKVRDIALRLALSEADFYRKQRVALAEVARVLLEMEEKARRTEKEDRLSASRAFPSGGRG